MMHLDVSARSVVVVCSSCGRREVFTTRAIALSFAAAHEEGHSQQAAKELRARLARVAASNARRRPPP